MAKGELKDGSNTMDFPHFDILSGDSAYSDHHYAFNNSKEFQDCINNPTNDVSKMIAKEWKILGENLPECIYVRVYEDRVDLLRAVIIGTPGTPYHDGLFFFDIVLPSDYPKKPPNVHYHSHGMPLNPNLHANGYVCLSLIHTWSGSGPELWIPGRSTILQLLVSLQGLVLNEEPYFNEPGHARFNKANETWIKQSRAYNEVVFIYSCKTMLYKVKNPPKGFESFVGEHFRSHGEFILAAITAYRKGHAVVGHYKEVGSSVSSSSFNVSRGFRSNLKKVHSNLKSAFLQMDTSPKIKNSMELQSLTEDDDDEDEDASPSPQKVKDSIELQSKTDEEDHGKAATTMKRQKHSEKGFPRKIFKVFKCRFY